MMFHLFPAQSCHPPTPLPVLFGLPGLLQLHLPQPEGLLVQVCWWEHQLRQAPATLCLAQAPLPSLFPGFPIKGNWTVLLAAGWITVLLPAAREARSHKCCTATSWNLAQIHVQSPLTWKNSWIGKSFTNRRMTLQQCQLWLCEARPQLMRCEDRTWVSIC